MKKKCPVCLQIFNAKRSDKVCCSKSCTYKKYNDSRPRKTNKSYIKSNQLKGERIPESHLDIIRGTLLGDACLVLQTDSFHRLSLCHGSKQKEYLQMKVDLLPSIFPNSDLTIYGKGDYTQFHKHSVSHKDLTNVYGEYYRNGKPFVTKKFLDLLSPTSLLFWYLDDGSMIRSSGNSIVLCTDAFSLSEVKTIKKWLWQRYNIDSNILNSHGGFSDKTYYRIRLNKESTSEFISVLKLSIYFNELPQNMMYKFHGYV